MAIYNNNEVFNNNGVVNGTQLVSNNIFSYCSDLPPSLSGTTLSATFTNTANIAGVYGTSSGTGTVEIDGAHCSQTAVLAPVYAANPATGGISAVSVSYGGAGYWGPGYSAAPIVTFSAPASGTNLATGTATVTNGIVSGITVTNPGSGYAPTGVTVTVSAPPPHYGSLYMADRTTFRFTVPNATAGSTTAVTLTAVGYFVVSPTQARLRNLGYI